MGREVKILRCPAAVTGTNTLNATAVPCTVGRRVSRQEPEAGRPIEGDDLAGGNGVLCLLAIPRSPSPLIKCAPKSMRVSVIDGSR